jgi:hypothetical protein
LTVTLSVKHMPAQVGQHGPVFVAGRLWLDAAGARLFEWDDDRSVPLTDAEACEAVRAALPPPGEYLGGALLQAWVRAGPGGPELHGVYWLVLGVLEGKPPSKWGPRVAVRPVPPEYDGAR